MSCFFEFGLVHTVNIFGIIAVIFLFSTGLYLFLLATNGYQQGVLLGSAGLLGLLAACALLFLTGTLWWFQPPSNATR